MYTGSLAPEPLSMAHRQNCQPAPGDPDTKWTAGQIRVKLHSDPGHITYSTEDPDRTCLSPGAVEYTGSYTALSCCMFM